MHFLLKIFEPLIGLPKNLESLYSRRHQPHSAAYIFLNLLDNEILKRLLSC